MNSTSKTYTVRVEFFAKFSSLTHRFYTFAKVLINKNPVLAPQQKDEGHDYAWSMEDAKEIIDLFHLEYNKQAAEDYRPRYYFEAEIEMSKVHEYIPVDFPLRYTPKESTASHADH